MTVRSSGFGGYSWQSEHPTKQDVEDTYNASAEASGRSGAQGAYQILQANDVFENKDYMAADEFLTSTGTNNTIDTGNTDASYDSDNNYYTAGTVSGSTITNDHGESLTDTGSNTNQRGQLIYTKKVIEIVSLTRASGNTATKAYIYTGTAGSGPVGLVASATFVSDVATFASPVQLTQSTNYWAVVDSEGGSYNIRFITGATLPITSNDYINWQNASYQAGTGVFTDGRIFEMQSVEANLILYGTGTTYSVETNEIIALESAPKSIEVYTDVTIPSDSTFTLDVSDDGGTSFDITNQPISGKTFNVDTSSLTGTSIALKFNLTTTNNATSPLFKGYGLFIIRGG